MPVETDAAAETVDVEPVVAVTDEALARILEIRDAEEDSTELVLRISVTGVNGPEYAYDLSFEEAAELDADDVRYHVGDLQVAVPGGDVEALAGAVLDLPSRPGQSGLVIRNPNRPNPLAGRTVELTGDLADKVNQLLDQSINPSLAAHGGYATLVGVEDAKVFLTMGGGCQGCALSAATLREGIQAAILDTIPEVTEVVDVTDHTAGDNPFYT
ncbi:MAG: NifU family protein [Acidimicrobiales bacterium]